MENCKTSVRVHVWDPNPFNPYGTEISRIISQCTNGAVVHFTRRSRPYAAPNTRQAAVLPSSTGTRRSLFHELHYLTGLLRFFFSTLLRQPVAVFPWISNKWEALFARTLQILGTSTVIIVHNPTIARDDIDRINFLRGVRKAADVLVVHTEYLASLMTAPAMVAAHPSYATWVSFLENSQASHLSNSDSHWRPCAIYLGSKRADKGFYELPDIAGNLADRGIDLIVCVGIFEEDDVRDLRTHANVEIVGDGSRYLKDEEIYDSLSRADVVVAPYHDVTVSGTVVLALTLGLPVVAYTAEAFRGILPSDALVRPGQANELAAAARRSLKSTSPAFAFPWHKSQDSQSILEWTEILGAIS